MDKFTVKTKRGKPVYEDEQGEEITTNKETLDWLIQVQLEPLKDFIQMAIENDSQSSAMFIAQVLIERAEKNIYEATDYITNNHGTIEIVSACYHQRIKPETKLGIEFTPCAEVTA